MRSSGIFLNDFVEKCIFIFITGSIIGLFFLWFICNVVQTNNYYLWIAAFPVGYIFSSLLSSYYPLYHEKVSVISIVGYILLFCCIAFASLYYLEPIIRYPFSAIGIPNKDLHDGIAAFIAAYGHPPSDVGASNHLSAFIPNTNQGLFLGYPNMLHVFGAYLIKLGIMEFFANWIAVLFVLILTSLSLYLLIKYLWGDTILAVLVSGLFMLSSFRIPFAASTSIPMLFAYALVIPTLVICFINISQSRGVLSYVFPMVAIAVLAVSYSGLWIGIFGILIFYLVILYFLRDRKKTKKTVQLIFISIPLLIFVLYFQKTIYWQNTFPTARDYDPYELSQFLFPVDKPEYMLFFAISLLVFIYKLVKRREMIRSYDSVAFVFLVANILLFFLLPFDAIFHALNHVFTHDSLIHVNPNGLFGGLNHQKVSRLALLQPFFFIIAFSAMFAQVKQNGLRYFLCIALLLTIGISRLSFDIYNPIQFDSLRIDNDQFENDPFVLLSHSRFITPYNLWTQDIMNGLVFLKTNEIYNNNTVLLFDSRVWSESSIAGWTSVYLKKKVIGFHGSSEKQVVDNFDGTTNSRPSLLLVIDPLKQTGDTLSKYKYDFKSGDVAVYHID